MDGILLVVVTQVLNSYSLGETPMTELPNDQHITYQLQFRKCGKALCSTCRNSQGHGPYWYAYWRDGIRLRSGYVGKMSPTPFTEAS